jgi:hypothetical protein
MTEPNQAYDPYRTSLLCAGLGPLLSRDEVLRRLTCLPPMPPSVGDIPKHIRLHLMLLALRSFHVPSLEEARLFETLDLMIRQSYLVRDPRAAATWARLSGEAPPAPVHPLVQRRMPLVAVVEGPSGTGKTHAIHGCLALYPHLIEHSDFPMLVNGLMQVVSLSLNAPSTGRTMDLATGFMMEWNRVTGTDRFDQELRRVSRRGQQSWDSCCQEAAAKFLGALHLDEVENFFQIPSLRERARSNSRWGAPEFRELRVIEDQCLKNVVVFTNVQEIPLILSGTNDGASALRRRLSSAERFAASGYHQFKPFAGADVPEFRDSIFAALGKYQFVAQPLPLDAELRALIIKLTAGIQRLIVTLWICAHRVAFERKSSDDLRLDDFRVAAATYMAPVADAVAALLSRDPNRLARYEDLLPRDERLWQSFWASGE